ncbi:MAG: hypothetical protein IPM46_05690 [Flavobacteriales bacterium]|nr:hypothetical protein [Flavobacteriales bacterium]
MMRATTIGLLVLTSLSAAAQRKELIVDKEAILARAAQAFDAALQPGAELHATVLAEDLIGRYVLQVSIRDHGDVSSVFVERRRPRHPVPEPIQRPRVPDQPAIQDAQGKAVSP